MKDEKREGLLLTDQKLLFLISFLSVIYTAVIRNDYSVYACSAQTNGMGPEIGEIYQKEGLCP